MQIVEIRALKRENQHAATKAALEANVGVTNHHIATVDYLNRRVEDLKEAIQIIKNAK